MNTKERIEELQEKRQEFILNESVFADDNPSWGEVAEATDIAESKWDETDDGKELKALLNESEDEQDDYDYSTQKNFDCGDEKMNSEIKRQLKAYYLAYKWANGEEKAKKLKLSYKRGWYHVNNDAVRLKDLQEMGRVLWSRKPY